MPSTTARLRLPHDLVAARLGAMIASGTVPGEAKGDTIVLHLASGSVGFLPEPEATALLLRAETPSDLQSLREEFAAATARMGIAALVDWPAPAGRHPPDQQVVRIAGRQRLSPSFLRLRLEGELSDYARPGAGVHFRLLFSRTGADWPTLDDQGALPRLKCCRR